MEEVVRGLARSALAVFGLALVVAACRQYLPTNRYLQLRSSSEHVSAAANVQGKFDHAAHAEPLASVDATCLDCHRFDVLIETSNEDLGRALARRALFAGTGACHFCHVQPETRMPTAPHTCMTCHDNLEALRPEDHDLSWIRVHASVAQTNPTRCEDCHRQSYCIECHQARDSIETLVHERNFRYFHAVEARANPMKCARCHRQDFCIRCHQQGSAHLGEE